MLEIGSIYSLKKLDKFGIYSSKCYDDLDEFSRYRYESKTELNLRGYNFLLLRQKLSKIKNYPKQFYIIDILVCDLNLCLIIEKGLIDYIEKII